MRGVDDVVARLERKRDGRGVDAAARAVLGHVPGQVCHGQDGELGRGHHDAGGHGGVDERHLAARKRRGAGRLVCLGVAERHAVLGGACERLAKHHVLVAKAELKVLARGAVGHGEQHGAAVCHELAHAAEQPRVAAGDARLAHGKLGGHLRAHAQHARERQALLATKVHVARGREQAFRGGAGIAGELLGLVGAAHAVVEQRAGLGEAHEGVRAHVLERARRLAVERGQVALERGLGATRLDEFEVRGELRVVLGGGP